MLWNKLRGCRPGGLSALALLAAWLPAFGALAKESAADNLSVLSFDELMQTKVSTVYAASKRQQEVSEAPAAVTANVTSW